MAIKILACFIILCLFLHNHGAHGHTQLSKSHKIKWEKQYKLFKKPSIKTIKTENGDVYNCVDFYKQPGLDHPLLKNHTFHPQMRPSFIPQQNKGASSLENERTRASNSIKLKSLGCPKGTVPIRRFTRREFFENMEFTQQYASRMKSNADGSNFALIQSKPQELAIFYGIGGRTAVYNVPVDPAQYTIGGMMVNHGDDRILVGWTVNPILNKDNQTRLFQYLNAGELHCFNMLCPGFVSVNPGIPIDVILQPVSIIGQYASVLPQYIYQDPKDGNWWLVIDFDKVVGFWPQKLFTGLAQSATQVAIGGETYSPPGLPLPPMGSGHYPEGDFDSKVIAHCHSIFIVDRDHHQFDLLDTEQFITNKVYGAVDKGQAYIFGHTIFYGGSP